MDKSSEYLYKGLREEEIKEGNTLIFKKQGPFLSSPAVGNMRCGDYLGETEKSAIRQHQSLKGKYPTSGVSVTPHFERAEHYATHEEKNGEVVKISGKDCVVVKINRQLLSKYGISERVVKEHIHPTEIDVPEDDEIILIKKRRANGSKQFPREIIDRAIKI